MTNQLIFPHLIFDSVFDEFFKSLPETRRIPNSGFPVVDHWVDEGGNANLALALAGYRVEDLNVSVEGSTVTVSSGGAEKENQGGTRRIARRAFKNTFTDRENVYDLGKLSASFINGELKIVIPRKEEAKAKTFKISTDVKKLTA